MKIGIYNQPSHGSAGGTEVSVGILAEALAKGHNVDIIHHRKTLDKEMYARRFGIDLSGVTLRYKECIYPGFSDARGRWQRYKDERGQYADVSAPYDVFIVFTHDIPPFCHAKRGGLMVLFPLLDIFARGDGNDDMASRKWRPRSHFGKMFFTWRWRRRMRTYAVKMANSEYTSIWTKRRWGIDCHVAYPPVVTCGAVHSKTDTILSVGRFAHEGHQKKQLEMVRAFSELKKHGLPDWQYISVGACDGAGKALAFFESVVRAGQECGADVRANVDHAVLESLYQSSKIFWHAAGLGEDEQEHPEWMEHFGMSTVEAMAAGCVPVVINRGGQAEIVQHGVSGFVWNTLDEMQRYTQQLIQDDVLWSTMSRAARKRSDAFTREKYVQRMCSLLKIQV